MHKPIPLTATIRLLILIYMCVCVCVCACARARAHCRECCDFLFISLTKRISNSHTFFFSNRLQLIRGIITSHFI